MMIIIFELSPAYYDAGLAPITGIHDFWARLIISRICDSGRARLIGVFMLLMAYLPLSHDFVVAV